MQKTHAKIAIIGAGASGIMAALVASERVRVDLFEQNERVGKKLLATGNGRCNITNTHATPKDYHGEDLEVVREALGRFGYREFEAFCKRLGLFLITREEGRCYPASNEAKSLLAALEESLQRPNLKLHLESKVIRLERERGRYALTLEGGARQGGYEAVILATGSNAAPQLGGGEAGYALAQALGHSLAPLYPALVQLHLDSPLLSRLAGVKSEGVARLWVEGKRVQEERGDLLWTHYGISGLAILDLSQAASWALLKGKKVELELDIAPLFERRFLQESLENLIQSAPGRTIHSILGGFISPKVAGAILRELRIEPETPLKNLAPSAMESILKRLKGWRFRVVQTHGFKHAEVSGGGVRTREIDPVSFESRRSKGLYIVGEVLDVVGRRGGYNLAFAWASGYLAALHASEGVTP